MTGLGPRYWRLYVSSATSNLADGVGRTALPLLAATLTRSPLLISGLESFAFLPWLLFGLFSGALVDRVDRRRAMGVANAARAIAALVVAVLAAAGDGAIALLYAAAFILGLAETVYDSSIRALVPNVVEPGRLDTANSLLTVEENLGQTFLGAPLGSALFALAIAAPLFLSAGAFAVAVVVLLTLGGSYRAARARESTSVRQDMAEGVRWLARHRLLRGLTVIGAITAFVQMMSTAVLVLYVLEILHLPSAAYGLILLAAGAGGLIGGLATPPLSRRFGRGRMLVIGCTVTGITTALMAATSNGYVAAALSLVGAAGVLVWNVLTISIRQTLIPTELFGRVQGAYRTCVWGAIPLGSITGGALASALGLRTVFVISGVALASMALPLGLLVRRHPAEIDAADVSAPLSPAGTG